MKTIRQKTALITGAGSGIGRALALELAANGADVIITDINKQALDKTVAEIRAHQVHSEGFVTDHTSFEDVEKFKQQFFMRYGHVDILCLNVGAALGGPFEKMTREDWQFIIDININSTLYMAQLFIPSMIERRKGHIMITASAAGLIGMPYLSAYSMTKFAMVGLAESLRTELSEYDIGVTALCPGIVNTDIIKNAKIRIEDNKASDSLQQFYEQAGATPEQIARDAINAIKNDHAILPTPVSVWAMWMAKRFSDSLFQNTVGFLWKSGLLKNLFGGKSNDS